MKECVECRICKSDKLTNIIDLGEQYNTSKFPKYKDFSTITKTKIVLCICEECYLVQLKYYENQSELYEQEYGYCSGISNTMKKHLKEYVDQILLKVDLNIGDIVVDIGSNDSTMLQYYSNNYRRIGVDPTGEQFKDYYKNGVELLPTYFTRESFVNSYGDIKCKVISSVSMFYDLPDPVQFAKDIYSILDDDGLWTCELSYLLSMLKKNSMDTICHEHLEYYSLYQIKRIADESGFKIIDIKFNECNGGSFRIYFSKKSSNKYLETRVLIKSILERESNENLSLKDTYKKFMERCDNEINKLKTFIDLINKNGQCVYIYGASTKGNCLLQYANISEKDIKYAVERNLNKVGKMTTTGIPIISEDEMRKNPPEFLLVLPWHFRNEIIKREKEFLNNGGKLLFPLPHFEIYSSK